MGNWSDDWVVGWFGNLNWGYFMGNEVNWLELLILIDFIIFEFFDGFLN